jgi:hypothetical protein
MNYTEFKEKLILELKKLFPESTIEVSEVSKNNSTSYDTLMIHSNMQKLSPCIRLRAYYDELINSDEKEGFTEVLHNIVAAYQAAINNKENNNLYDALSDYNAIKDRITCRMVNRVMNQKLLASIPYTEFLNEFVITYSIVTNLNGEGIESIRATNALLEYWNISLVELHEVALENTIRLFPKVSFRMDEIICSMLGQPVPEQEAEGGNMYVLSNQQGINGATVLIYPDALSEFISQYQVKGKYLVILPSSIHEIILVPAENLSMQENLRQMVKDVNQSEVAEDEILSNQILIYDCEEDIIFCNEMG